eukprot:gene11718-24572_t
MKIILFVFLLHSRRSFIECYKPSIQRFNKFHFRLLNSVPTLEDKDVWTARRKIIRSSITPIIKQNIEKEKSPVSEESQGSLIGDRSNKLQFIFSAAILTIGVLAFRLGGRVAFMQFLGLDFMTQNGVNEQMNDFITFFQTLGNFQFISFLLVWTAVKLLCIDALTVILALSSGVLFGGLWQGTLASVSCSTIASYIAFALSRYIFREKAQAEIARRPAFRAVDRACSKEGLKTVFVLRLSPLIPIPI